jgi:hypothetical protein
MLTSPGQSNWVAVAFQTSLRTSSSVHSNVRSANGCAGNVLGHLIIVLIEKLGLGPGYAPHLSMWLTPRDSSLELVFPPVLSPSVIGFWLGS